MPLAELTAERIASLLPAGAFAAAMDYLLDGRVTARVRRGERIYAHVRGYSDAYRVAFDGEALSGACECGRAQPCRHAAAVALAWAAERDSFLDLDRLLAQLTGSDAEAALAYVVDRCLGPEGVDSALALLELSSADGDRDPLNLDAFLAAVRRLALCPAPARAEAVGELRVRAGRLAARQGRTAGVRALAALLAEATRAGDLALAADLALTGELRAAAADLAALLKPGGLSATALRPAWLDLGAAVMAAPPGLASDLLHAGTLLGAAAADYLIQRTRAALALACAEAAADEHRAGERGTGGKTGDGQTPAALASERARGLAAALVDFLLAQGRDDDAVAFARAEARGPVGPQPLIAALAGAGRWDEAIAQAQAALAAADSAAVRTWRRTLADLYRLAGRPTEALPYLAANYDERPDEELYRELRELACACGVWPELRSEVLGRLRAAAAGRGPSAGRHEGP